MSKRMTLEEAANNVCRCINDSARRRELEWIRITQGDQFAKLVEQLVAKDSLNNPLLWRRLS